MGTLARMVAEREPNACLATDQTVKDAKTKSKRVPAYLNGTKAKGTVYCPASEKKFNDMYRSPDRNVRKARRNHRHELRRKTRPRLQLEMTRLLLDESHKVQFLKQGQASNFDLIHATCGDDGADWNTKRRARVQELPDAASPRPLRRHAGVDGEEDGENVPKETQGPISPRPLQLLYPDERGSEPPLIVCVMLSDCLHFGVRTDDVVLHANQGIRVHLYVPSIALGKGGVWFKARARGEVSAHSAAGLRAMNAGPSRGHGFSMGWRSSLLKMQSNPISRCRRREVRLRAGLLSVLVHELFISPIKN